METLKEAATNPALPFLIALIGGGIVAWMLHRHERQLDTRLDEREQERRYMATLDPIQSSAITLRQRRTNTIRGARVIAPPTTDPDELFTGDLALPVDRSLRAQVERRVDNPRLDWSRYPYDRHGDTP